MGNRDNKRNVRLHAAEFSGGILTLLARPTFINYVDRGNLATAAPLIKSELELSNAQYGLLVSAFIWAYFPGQLVTAWLVQRIYGYHTGFRRSGR